jgi:hypothetical protein
MRAGYRSGPWWANWSRSPGVSHAPDDLGQDVACLYSFPYAPSRSATAVAAGLHKGTGSMSARTHRVVTACSFRLAGAVAVMVFGLSFAGAGAATPKLQGLIVQSGDMPGFTPSNDAQSATSLARWIKVERVPRAEAAQLREAGFVAGLQEGLSSTSGSPGVDGGTGVWFFKTPAGAKSYDAYMYSSNAHSQAPFRQFNAGVTGARSFVATGSKGTVANTYFATGHCVVWIGDFLAIHSGSPLATSPVAVAAEAVHARDIAACK